MVNLSAVAAALFLLAALLPSQPEARGNSRHYSKADLVRLKDEVSAMFHHAYEGYLQHAYPYDELRPISCTGVDTWGSYSLTLIDSLDTLAVLGNYSEFRRVYQHIADTSTFDADINVSVFETNIRIVGGLLGAHLLARRAGADVEPGWPCEGPLLRLAEDVATRLLPAFDTPTGMPYGTVNLRHGVPRGETPVTCTAGVGTMIVELGALTKLTGNPVFEETALRALRALWHYRSPIGLMGNHIDVLTGKWTSTDAGIGAGVDSYYEYLVKGAVLLQRPELMHMFRAGQAAIEQYMNHDDWYFWVAMKQGTVTLPVFQSLEAFWPGLLSLVGENSKGLKSVHNYHQIWKQYGFLPEFYNVAQGGAANKREGYPLRPELIESVMYLYRATKDPYLLTVGEDMLQSIQYSARTECGYATVKDVRDHTLEDRMESFFLAETTKYLYLLFDEDNFIHNRGNSATVVDGPDDNKCVVDAGGYIFNTEAHVIDPAALACCSSHTEKEVRSHLASHMLDILDPSTFNEFRGDLIPERLLKISEERTAREEERKEKRKEYEMMMAAQRKKEREALKRRKELEDAKKQMEERLDREIKEEKAAAAGIPVDTPWVDTKFERKSNNASGSDAIDAKEDDAEETRGIGIGSSLEETTDSPDFEGHAGEAKEVSVREEGDGKKPHILLKRQSKDETTEDLENASYANDEEESGGQSDDGEVSSGPTTSTKGGSGMNSPEQMVEALTDMLSKLIVGGGKSQADFDLDAFTARVMKKDQYSLNPEWYGDHFIMSCPAQSFLERFSLQGEFFESYP